MSRLGQVFFILAMVALPSGAGADPARLHLVCDNWPPYQIVENGKVSGFSTAVVTEVLARMGVREIPLDVYPWKRAVRMLEKGDADGLFSANYTVERTEFSLYPEEAIVDSPWVMWVRKEGGPAPESWQDLAGFRVGLVSGYSYTPEFWRFMKHQGRYEEVVSDEQNFRKLNAGRVDVIVAELGNGLYLRKRLCLTGIVPLTRNPVKVDGLYLIFNRERISRSFVREFSTQLTLLKKEPFYRQLYDEHFRFSAAP